MAKKAYIAFSIHGTCAFITATRTFKSEKAFYDHIMLNGMKVAVSRRPDHDPEKDGTKLEWDRLMVKETITDKIGKQDVMRPLRSPQIIVSRFSELEKLGWKIEKKKFIERHWKRGGPNPKAVAKARRARLESRLLLSTMKK